MNTERKSPVLITLRGNRIEVEHRETGDLLAYCFLGDELACEDIADSLSAKRLGKEAMKFREMVRNARPRC
jgi:hypothetical protein